MTCQREDEVCRCFDDVRPRRVLVGRTRVLVVSGRLLQGAVSTSFTSFWNTTEFASRNMPAEETNENKGVENSLFENSATRIRISILVRDLKTGWKKKLGYAKDPKTISLGIFYLSHDKHILDWRPKYEKNVGPI